MNSLGFHPTLVLAQPGRDVEQLAVRRVSIPHWFSLNGNSRSFAHQTSFCFHPTLVLAQQADKSVIQLPEYMFPSHIGSRSTLVDARPIGRALMFPSHIGSRSTSTDECNYLAIKLFPSHIGSRSTRWSTPPCLIGLRFHPTLVLAQRKDKEIVAKVKSKFPSHIGSRSTSVTVSDSWCRRVSIPHWFSLNSSVREMGSG